jgi:ABC-type transporter Mla subunit MlaD
MSDQAQTPNPQTLDKVFYPVGYRYHSLKLIDDLIGQIDDAKAQIEALANEEQEKFDKLPEGLQDTAIGQLLSEAAEALYDAASNIEDAISNLDAAQG